MSQENKKLYLLDAYALIFRAYYAFIRAPRVNSKGLNTSAIFGFVNSLMDIIQRESPSHLAVVIDYPGPTFRNEMYAEYKANRESTPEDIKIAVPYIKQILKAMNIPLIEKEGFEADDVIGTIAKKAANSGYTTYMVTPDKDYAQLVDENIFMYKPKSRGNEIEILGVDEIKENFSVKEPIHVIDILSLWGDTADNIPGCPGVGEKRSKELISQYHTIENIYNNIDDFKGKLKENLINFKDQVELARALVTIETNVPVEFNFEDFKLESPNLAELSPIFEELEFRTLINKLSGEKNIAPVQGSLFDIGNSADSVPEVLDVSFKTIVDVPHQYYLIDNEMALASLAVEISMQSQFCFDIETTSLDVKIAKIVGIAFSWKEHEAYYVAFPNDENGVSAFLKILQPIFENQESLKIGQNLKYDISVLLNNGIYVAGPKFDTMIAHHLVQPGLKHNMDYLAEIYLNYKTVPIENLIGPKGKNQKSMASVDLDLVKEYAGEDADITFQLMNALSKELDENNLTTHFQNVEMPLMDVLIDMENCGVSINSDALAETAKELNEKLATIEQSIEEMAGISFNINSPKQVGDILFEHLKIDAKAVKTKTGQYSTSEDVLQKIKDKHPIIPLILEQRGLTKLLSTYVLALPQLVDEKSGRIHTSYNQTVVVTGRLSSTNPNLQNIPIRDEEGRMIRKAFVPKSEDFIFLSADYSQIELRIMAHLSQDKHLIEAFNNGEDIHAATASKIFDVNISDVDSDMRRKAKTANFGIIYGISAFGLAERLDISRSEAKSIIDGYFENFPEVKIFMDNAINSARDKGYVETISGRRRYLPDINSRNAIVRGVAERNAINAPIQGTAADLIKIAMVEIFKEFEKRNLKSKMIMQVHDELNFEVETSEIDEVKNIVKTKMESAYKLSIPLSVDIGVGKNWLEAH